MEALKMRRRYRGVRKILKKVVYSRRKIEIIRKNVSPRVDLPAQRGGGLKPPSPSPLATAKAFRIVIALTFCY